MPVSELVCPSCGERNSAGTQFCTSCNTYLAWELTMIGSEPLRTEEPSVNQQRQPALNEPAGPDERTKVIRQSPRLGPVGRTPHGPTIPSPPANPTGPTPVRPVQLFRAVIEPAAITVTPGGPAAAITVQVFNLSAVVDGLTVALVSPPAFLKVDAKEVRLLPTTDETVALSVAIPLTPMVVAGTHQLTVGVRSSTHVGVTFTGTVTLTVGVIDGPITLALEPSLVRARDTTTAQLKLAAENLTGNRPVPLTLAGSDPEGLVRFVFSPPILTVPPGGTATAMVRLTAPAPEAGQEASRPLTITASEGTRELSVAGTLVQVTSSREVRLTLEPSLVKIRDTGGAQLRLLVANASGTRPVRLPLRGSDPERAVRFTFSPPVLIVPPGGTAVTSVHLEAPEPEPGQEVSRVLTITAGESDDQVSVTGTLNQSTSALALAVWLEPSLVRVRDSVYGQSQVVVDNRGSRRVMRLTFTGSDPERLVRFTFNPPVFTIRPGAIAAAQVFMEAPLPEDGREVSHPITVHASTGDRTVEATGTFLQSTSAPAISALTLRLDPSVVRVHDSADASLDVIADNRDGQAPVQVYLDGSDPERVVQFFFEPQVLEIPPGGWALSRVRVRAPRPERGKELTRQIKVAASDDRRTVEATGSYIQTTSDRRPLIRTVLTTLGGLLMAVGVFYPWTNSPDKRTGLEWSLVRFADAIHINLKDLNIDVLKLGRVTASVQSAGLLALALAGLTLFGLTGSKGRLTRAGSALTLLFVVAFSLAFRVRADSWEVGIGAILVAVGAITAFVGGLYARR